MFQIKICGVTSVEDAVMVAEAGADAVGLNFFHGSKRYVTPEVAAAIVAALPRRVAKVGVFVNASVVEVDELAARLPLDWVQLHGDEPPELLLQVQHPQLIRALRCPAEGPASLAAYLESCQTHGRLPGAVLVDALAAGGEYGGTGQRAPWELLAGERAWLAGQPLVLAGGLVPENVGAAIEQVRPAAVDTASGVEASPGRKDRARLAAFIAEARQAFARLAAGA